MKTTTITIADARSNLPKLLERVGLGERFVLTQNGIPVAHLIQPPKAECRARELARALERVAISPGDARTWNRDLAAGRKILTPPVDKWR